MDAQMLAATREAAWAAQSAAEAAWWGVFINGAVVLVAIGATLFQEWRVNRRVMAAQRDLHQGAVDTVRQGWVAVTEAASFFRRSGRIDELGLGSKLRQVIRARRLIALFVAREVDPKILIGLLQMDDHLAETEGVLTRAASEASASYTEYAAYNGRIDRAAASAELIFISLV